MQKTTSPNKATKHQASNSAKPPRHHISKSDICFIIFVLAWALLSTIAGQFISSQILGLILGSKLSQPGWMLLYYICSYAITLALIIFIPPQLVKIYQQQHDKKQYAKASRKLSEELSSTPISMGIQKLPTFVDIGLAPIGYIVYIFFANIIVNLMSNIFQWFNAGQEQDVGFNYFGTHLDQVFAMLAIVFVAPIAEELIMRGWLYGKVRQKLKNVPLAIILVSLLFAVLHGQWNVGVTVFVLSVVLCTLREVTGTIWAGMLLHMLSNGIAFYLLLNMGV